MNKPSPVDFLVTEIDKMGFSCNSTDEFYHTVQIAREMEIANDIDQNRHQFRSLYAIEIPATITREEVWSKAWSACANAETCLTAEAATNWADKCLAAFDQRFSNKGGNP